ncbi:MAG: DUF2723 domain-containing protein, partial [Endomicrobiia bacterium]
MKLIVFTSFVFILTFGIYLSMCCPTVTSDDSGELSGVCATLGIAHPSGYPVYSVVGKIINIFFPFGNNAYRTNLVSVLFGALTVTFIFYLIANLTQTNTFFIFLLSFFSVLIVAFSKHFISMAIVTEVYTLNSFFAVIILLFMFYNKIPIEKRFYFISFIFGLSIGNHITIVFILPCILLWLILNYKDINFTFKKIVIAMFFLLLGISIYLYIPLRSVKEPLFDWEDPQTLKRFFNLVRRARYGGHIAQGKPLPITLSFIFQEFKLFIEMLSENITSFGVIVFFVLLLLTIRNRFQPGLISLLFLILTGPFFFTMARMPVGEQSKALLERFVYLPLVPVGLIIGSGAEAIYQKNKFFGKVLLVIFLILLTTAINRNFSELNR